MKNPCPSTQHNYFPIKENYYKTDGKTNELGLTVYDQTVAFSMLCCSKCGQTMEVVSADHRKKEVNDGA